MNENEWQVYSPSGTEWVGYVLVDGRPELFGDWRSVITSLIGEENIEEYDEL